VIAKKVILGVAAFTLGWVIGGVAIIVWAGREVTRNMVAVR
jgi:hypothetical protein